MRFNDNSETLQIQSYKNFSYASTNKFYRFVVDYFAFTGDILMTKYHYDQILLTEMSAPL